MKFARILPAVFLAALPATLAGGLVTQDRARGVLTVESNLNFFGSKSEREVNLAAAKEVALMWNESKATVTLADGSKWPVEFKITFTTNKPVPLYDSCQENFIRIESLAAKPPEFAANDVSLIERGTNRGRWYVENDLGRSTTAAHEFGHLLGLAHSVSGKKVILDERTGLYAEDFRDAEVPGIMFNRGTWVRAEFQYDPSAEAGKPGGTINPYLRKVRAEDVRALNWAGLRFNERGQACLGYGKP